MIIPKSVAALRHCTDKESKRYALGGIFIDRTSDTEVAAAVTDGRTMAVVTWDAARNGEGQWQGGVVPCEHLADACKPSIVKAELEAATENTITLVTHDKKLGKQSRTVQLIEGRFPRYKDVIPYRQTGNQVTLDLNLLQNLVLAMKASCNEDETPSVVIDLGDKVGSDPITLTVEHVAEGLKSAIGIIMPMRKS